MTDQPDLDAIEAATRHALESMVPGHLVSAALHALALLAEVRKLREALKSYANGNPSPQIAKDALQ